MEDVAKVLIVEDNIDDLRVMERAFRHPRGWEVRVALDGAEALDALGFLEHTDDPWRPNLIILNLNMPKICGHGILEKIKQRPDLAPIPVVVWSVSCDRKDIDLSYRLGAAAYFSKPVDTEGLSAQGMMIRKFFESSKLYNPA